MAQSENIRLFDRFCWKMKQVCKLNYECGGGEMRQIPNHLNAYGSLHHVILINGVGLKKGVKKKL